MKQRKRTPSHAPRASTASRRGVDRQAHRAAATAGHHTMKCSQPASPHPHSGHAP